MALLKNRSAVLLLTLVVLELVLVSYYIPQAEASKKKLMRKLKKIKDILPILLALKAKKKKIILLPIPMPMKGDMDMKMNMDWNSMPMMQDPCPMQMSYPMMDCGNNDFGGAQSYGGGNGGGYGGNGGNGGNFRGGNGGGY